MDYLADFKTNTINDVFILTVILSRATLKEAGELNKILSKAISDGWIKIIIELDMVEFIDSTFLGVLVINSKKVTELNGNLRLKGFQPTINTIIEQISLNRTFKNYSSLEEALKDF